MQYIYKVEFSTISKRFMFFRYCQATMDQLAHWQLVFPMELLHQHHGIKPCVFGMFLRERVLSKSSI